MSVQTEIDRIITAVQAAHEKVAEKGGTTTQPYLVGNLASAIDTIPNATDPVLQAKTVTPTTAKQTVTADSGYDGLSKVEVNAMPTATQATPSITVSSGGLITAKSTQTAGYVASGTKQATKQLTTQAAKTVTPTKSSQTAVASGVYTTGAVTVAAIPNTYVKPTATKAAATYTPSTSNQTIAAGTYCSGIQTIKGDANLRAENIAEGVSIFGVTGTHEGGTTPTGTLNITENGTYDVTQYASASVNVAGSGGGGSVETCTVTIIIPSGTTSVFGYGTHDSYISANNGSTWTALGTNIPMPGTAGNSHALPIYHKYVFANLPVGSVFTFYDAGGITGASTSGDIEFGLANHTTSSKATYLFGVCKCNGDGTITIETS